MQIDNVQGGESKRELADRFRSTKGALETEQGGERGTATIIACGVPDSSHPTTGKVTYTHLCHGGRRLLVSLFWCGSKAWMEL